MAKAKYSVTLNRDVITTMGHLVVMSVTTGEETIIAPPTTFTQTAGPRGFQTKKHALGFVEAQRAAHGHDVCSDVTTI